jgi:hypothetical protein
MKMLMLVAMFSLFFYTGAGYLQTLQALSLISGNHAALLQLRECDRCTVRKDKKLQIAVLQCFVLAVI